MQLADITSQVRGDLIIKTYQPWLHKKDKVLDVGCGNGVISEILKQHFNLNITGCDTLSYLTRPIKFVQMTSENKLPFKNKQFDAVMFNDVLHHIEYLDQEKLLQEAVRVGKKVLLFELRPTWMGTLADWLINKIHNPQMRVPFTYRSIDNWQELFKKLEVKAEVVIVSRPIFYPFPHVGYCLTTRVK